jgi:hypothetical protein
MLRSDAGFCPLPRAPRTSRHRALKRPRIAPPHHNTPAPAPTLSLTRPTVLRLAFSWFDGD